MAYLGVFGLSAVFAAIGAIPLFFAAGASPFLVLAFLRISGEIPEMYLYYIIVSVLQPKKRAEKAKSSKKKKKNKKNGRQTSDVLGFGSIVVPAATNTKNSSPHADETIQSVLFAGNHTPIELTLEIGFRSQIQDSYSAHRRAEDTARCYKRRRTDKDHSRCAAGRQKTILSQRRCRHDNYHKDCGIYRCQIIHRKKKQADKIHALVLRG